MKKIIFGFFVLIALASCRRSGEVTPAVIDTDAVIHHITFIAPGQYAATSVTGNKLRIIYYENISLLIPSNGLNLSYALHLQEDFSNSALFNFDYTTIDSYGDVNFDWVDDNINDIKQKTLTDTMVNSMQMTKISIQRPFTFSKTYADSLSAVAQENVFLAKETDKMIISSFVFFGKTYPASTATMSLFYVKAK